MLLLWRQQSEGLVAVVQRMLKPDPIFYFLPWREVNFLWYQIQVVYQCRSSRSNIQDMVMLLRENEEKLCETGSTGLTLSGRGKGRKEKRMEAVGNAVQFWEMFSKGEEESLSSCSRAEPGISQWWACFVCLFPSHTQSLTGGWGGEGEEGLTKSKDGFPGPADGALNHYTLYSWR